VPKHREGDDSLKRGMNGVRNLQKEARGASYSCKKTRVQASGFGLRPGPAKSL